MESGSSCLLSTLQVSAAQRPRSPRPLACCLPSPPPASSLILQAACQEGPEHAQACTRAPDSQGRPGRQGETAARCALLQACRGRPLHSIYTRPGRATSCPPRPAWLQPARLYGFFCFLLDFFLPKSQTSSWTFPSPKSQTFRPVPTRTAWMKGQPWAEWEEREADPVRTLSSPPLPAPCTPRRPGCRQTAHFQGAPGPMPERSTRVQHRGAAKRRLQEPRPAQAKARDCQNGPQVTLLYTLNRPLV
jgi:hypothetical protein